MQTLNLPGAALRIRTRNEKQEVFDSVRKRFVALTPEEWVRQHFVHFLADHLHVPRSLIAVEASLRVNRLKKRTDIVVYGTNGIPCLIVECKAPEVAVTQSVFDQVAMYNMAFSVPFLAVTNGLVHFVCHIDHADKKIVFLKEMPVFEEMMNHNIKIQRP
jgi:type I site-specific restriction-modification system R (restriction) subunit